MQHQCEQQKRVPAHRGHSCSGQATRPQVLHRHAAGACAVVAPMVSPGSWSRQMPETGAAPGPAAAAGATAPEGIKRLVGLCR